MKPKIAVTLRLSDTSVYLPRIYIKTVLEFGGIPFMFSEIKDEEDVEHIVNSVAGVLIPGGGDVHPKFYGEEPGPHLRSVWVEKDVLELELVRRAVERKLPVLGICRGAQVINVALGGTLIQHLKGTEIEHHQGLPYEHVTHEIEIEEGSFLHRLTGKTRIMVNSFHHQAVKDLGEGLRAVAWSPDGVIEAIEGGNFILGLQPHIEWLWMKEKAWANVFSAFIEACKNRVSS